VLYLGGRARVCDGGAFGGKLEAPCSRHTQRAGGRGGGNGGLLFGDGVGGDGVRLRLQRGRMLPVGRHGGVAIAVRVGVLRRGGRTQ
jgi:hypothetical protein